MPNLKIIPNPDTVTYLKTTLAVSENDGYCPCMLDKTIDTKCVCKEFREQEEVGLCNCGRYMKVRGDTE